jgi:hypothetical protein
MSRPLSTALACALALAAASGPPGEWTRVTGQTGRNIDEPAMARAPDGTLHVVALERGAGSGLIGLIHYAVGADGRVLEERTPVLEGWRSLSNPWLMVDGDSLRVLVSGVRGSTPGDPFDGGIYTLTAPLDGTQWALQDASVTRSKSTAAPGAARGKDGVVVAWAGSGGLFFHQAVGGSGDDQEIPTTGCCTYDPAAAADAATGEIVIGWYSNITNAHGRYTTVVPGAGAPQFAPGSATADRASSLSPSQRFALTARLAAPGVYAAYCAGYPTCAAVNLWRHGAAEALTVARPRNTRAVAVAPGPEGRLWVMWQDGTELRATRTNRAASRVGPLATVTPPPGAQTVWRVNGDGATGPLDLLATIGAAEGISVWHTQVLPILALTASPTGFTAGDTARVTFTVTDAGDPVLGATIEIGGQRLTSDAAGRATMPFAATTRPGQIRADATLEGYAGATTRITVRPPPPPRR